MIRAGVRRPRGFVLQAAIRPFVSKTEQSQFLYGTILSIRVPHVVAASMPVPARYVSSCSLRSFFDRAGQEVLGAFQTENRWRQQ
jgi:hypothetical protein